MLSKEELKKEFQKSWEKNYKLKVLEEYGFERMTCKACGTQFWSTVPRDFCEDANCVGYQFIGNSPVKTKLDYVQTWKKIEDYFTRNGHTSLKPYPTVARWRDDLYFNIASICDFQPYVVNGEIEPPANPLIVPQTCIRFGDVSNVGVTGRHYTNFVMVGQHAFNSDKTGLFYWKEEAIRHDIECLKSLGLEPEHITFKEDMWMGGGSFGPSMEFFCKGLELGNCVFQEYRITGEQSYEPLKLKVIDMGAGLSRLCWITNPVATSYELVFPEVAEFVKQSFGIRIDQGLFLKYAKLSGTMNADEQDVDAQRKIIAGKLGMEEKELVGLLEPLFAAYALCDHTQTLLFTVSDGMLPSNSGGGYNLRMILRRCFGFEEKFGVAVDYAKVFELHDKSMRKLFPSLEFLPETLALLVEEERKKYLKSKNAGSSRVQAMVREIQNGKRKGIGFDDLKTLYQSYGIPAELVQDEARKKGIEIELKPNFYNEIRESEETKQEQARLLEKEYPKTTQLCYGKEYEHTATVLGVEGKNLILDRSAFYPEGGGQCGDTGEIEGVRVLDTKKDSGVVVHVLEKGNAFKVGQQVRVKVDSERRKQIAKNHTGAHLLHGAAVKVLGKHVWQHGSGKDEFKAHLDLTHYKRITEEEIARIEEIANSWIQQNLQVTKTVVSRTEAESRFGMTLYQGGYVPGKELRIVSVGGLEGVDVEACGGTHVDFTGEIGFFKVIRRDSVQDNLERITFACGKAALAHVQGMEKLLRESSGVFSVAQEQLPATCSRFFSEWKEKDKTIDSFIELLAERMLLEEKNVHELGLSKPLLQKLAGKLLAGKKELLITNGKQTFALSPSGKAKELLGEFLKTKGIAGEAKGSGKLAIYESR